MNFNVYIIHKKNKNKNKKKNNKKTKAITQPATNQPLNKLLSSPNKILNLGIKSLTIDFGSDDNKSANEDNFEAA
jgi:hypothetical protein